MDTGQQKVEKIRQVGKVLVLSPSTNGVTKRLMGLIPPPPPPPPTSPNGGPPHSMVILNTKFGKKHFFSSFMCENVKKKITSLQKPKFYEMLAKSLLSIYSSSNYSKFGYKVYNPTFPSFFHRNFKKIYEPLPSVFVPCYLLYSPVCSNLTANQCFHNLCSLSLT